MLKSLAITTTLASAAAVALILIVFGFIDGPVQLVRAGAGDVTLVAIDTVIDDDGDQHEDGTQGSAGDDQCTDGIDNDADTLTDASDTACQTGQFLDNDDTAIGTVNNCFELSAIGDTLTFDLVVQGVDPVDKIKGYQFDIDYDPRVIHPGVDDDGDTLFDEDPGGVFADFADNDGDTQIDEDDNDFIDVDAATSTPPNDVTILSRLGSGGGVGFLHLSDTQAAPGSATVAAADGTISPADEALRHEDGEGVLARIVVTAVGNGVSQMVIPSTIQSADVINGDVDINDDGSINASDDGTLGFDIIDGKMDINNDGSIDANDDGTFAGKDSGNSFGIFDVINGQVDTSDDGSIGAADDGTIQVGGGADGFIDTTVTAGTGPLSGNPIPVDALGNAAISVGEECVVIGATPTPTPVYTPTPVSTATPTPTPTPAGPTPARSPSTTATPTGSPASGPGAAPPTGDGIPVDEGGGSILSWLFVGLGTALALTATGYIVYGRSTRRLTH